MSRDFHHFRHSDLRVSARSPSCTQQQNRLDGALGPLHEPRPQASEQQPHRREEPLSADEGHRQGPFSKRDSFPSSSGPGLELCVGDSARLDSLLCIR